MPRIDYVQYEDAPRELQEALDGSAYAESEERHLFYEMLANVPSVFAERVAYFGELMSGGTVPRREKELAYLTVAFVTDTRFVAATHARYLVDDHDVPPETLTELGEGDPSSLTDRDRAVVAFADQVARDPGEVSDGDLDALRAAGYDDGAIVELLLLVCEAQTATAIVTMTEMSLSDRGETAPNYLPEEFEL
jgi:uncharacterized peroxidase-related enzyme